MSRTVMDAVSTIFSCHLPIELDCVDVPCSEVAIAAMDDQTCNSLPKQVLNDLRGERPRCGRGCQLTLDCGKV
jgi:hypothetical protein